MAKYRRSRGKALPKSKYRVTASGTRGFKRRFGARKITRKIRRLGFKANILRFGRKKGYKAYKY